MFLAYRVSRRPMLPSKKLFVLSFPSTHLAESVKLIDWGLDVWLLYSFIDVEKGNKLFNSGFVFEKVVSCKKLGDAYVAASYDGVHDQVVEITDSEWAERLQRDFHGGRAWPKELHHYAIFFENNGLFEFYASSVNALPIGEGLIDNLSSEVITHQH